MAPAVWKVDCEFGVIVLASLGDSQLGDLYKNGTLYYYLIDKNPSTSRADPRKAVWTTVNRGLSAAQVRSGAGRRLLRRARRGWAGRSGAAVPGRRRREVLMLISAGVARIWPDRYPDQHPRLRT
jgi:hypothetical protein